VHDDDLPMAARRSPHRNRRRSRRHCSDDGWRFEAHLSDERLGPDLESPSLEEVLAATERYASRLPSWPEAEPLVVPLFDRVRPYPPGYPPLLHTIVPPGMRISLGIDVGPAFMHVSQQMLDDWSMTLADVTASALANLHARAAQVQPGDVISEPVDGVPVVALQTGLGIGSTLTLAPAEMARLFGPQPRVFIAPMRDLLLGMPPDEVELAAWLYNEIASQDPNRLPPRAFAFDGRSVQVNHLAAGLTAA
jgi:hypothetical protein